MVIKDEDDFGWVLQFKRQLKVEERSWLTELFQLLGSPSPQQQGVEDEIKCSYMSQEYSAKECYDFLCKEDRQLFPVKMIWKNAVPSKVSIMIWLAMQNAIPTIDNLRRRVTRRLVIFSSGHTRLNGLPQSL
ncbi:Reverse transcriptase zinc-binding domain [Macleaya cordata]|uniref:Reverse transcriptase zinc-binding domain n=1 Tax=Macleaya cordata TaxID=56857 RepID=A0A200QM91_MACCD|nr:Reverse transcriptase zinc-binding domain [Macleaya cordata]